MDTDQTGQIDIYRPHKLYALLRSYSIWIDNKKAKKIGDGERVFIPVSQGLHNIFVKMGFKKSNAINFHIMPRQTIKLLVWYRPFKGFLSIALKCLYIALIIIGAAVIPYLIVLGTVLLIAHRTGKLHLFEIEQ